jgi:hypothetical protein
MSKCSYFLQTLTKVKAPEKIMPAECTKVTSFNHPSTSSDEVITQVQSNIQHAAPTTTADAKLEIQEPVTDSGSTTLPPQTSQSVQAGDVTLDTPVLDKVLTGAQSRTENAAAAASHPEVKAEELEIKKEEERFHLVTTVKTEEPEIKKEEEFSSSDTMHKTTTLKENRGSVDQSVATIDESQVGMNNSPSTTEKMQVPTENQVTIEKSSNTEESQVATKENATTQPDAELLSAYNNLFLIYYGRAPIIDAKDISNALQQAEILIRVAELYGSNPVIRPYLGNCMMQFGRDVYTAILQDPPRWLQLSLYLESAPIFKEAIIHITGNLPLWPWPTVQLRDFPDDLKGPGGFFERKLNYLEALQRDVDRKLTMSSIKINGEEAQLDTENKKTYNTWLVLQLWKNWFVGSISKDESPNPTTCNNGMVYRLISKGGNAYLPSESIVAQIKAIRDLSRMLKRDRQEIEEDLKLMKDFAQEEVCLLCVNNCMLGVEEAGIKHLTCTKVENNELPWVNDDGL